MGAWGGEGVNNWWGSLLGGFLLLRGKGGGGGGLSKNIRLVGEDVPPIHPSRNTDTSGSCQEKKCRMDFRIMKKASFIMD